jgi:hypothetical protein
MDRYFGLFSLNKHDSGVFWNDGEAISSKNGVLSSGESLGFAIPGFCSCGFLKNHFGTKPFFLISSEQY